MSILLSHRHDVIARQDYALSSSCSCKVYCHESFPPIYRCLTCYDVRGKGSRSFSHDRQGKTRGAIMRESETSLVETLTFCRFFTRGKSNLTGKLVALSFIVQSFLPPTRAFYDFSSRSVLHLPTAGCCARQPYTHSLLSLFLPPLLFLFSRTR